MRLNSCSCFSFQRDHFMLALVDLFSRFSPQVPRHMFDVTFVPVVDVDADAADTDDDAARKMSLPENQVSRLASFLKFGFINIFSISEIISKIHLKNLRRDSNRDGWMKSRNATSVP